MTPELHARLYPTPKEEETKPVRHRAVTSEPLTHNPFEELRSLLDKRGFRHPFITKEREENYMATEAAEPNKRNRRVQAATNEQPPPVPQVTPLPLDTAMAGTFQATPLTPDDERLIRYTRRIFRFGQLMVGAAMVVGAGSYIAKTALQWNNVLKGPKVG